MSKHPQQESDLFIIRESAIHGSGAFARREIARGERITQYRGEKVTKQQSLERQQAGNQFLFSVDDEFDLDGAVEGNPARFFNHACDPNCEASLENREIWLIALRPIRRGEELTFNYGYNFEDYRSYPCSCGSPRCVGYILAEEFWPLLPARTEA